MSHMAMKYNEAVALLGHTHQLDNMSEHTEKTMKKQINNSCITIPRTFKFLFTHLKITDL
jgi:hypothetical protein